MKPCHGIYMYSTFMVWSDELFTRVCSVMSWYFTYIARVQFTDVDMNCYQSISPWFMAVISVEMFIVSTPSRGPCLLVLLAAMPSHLSSLSSCSCSSIMNLKCDKTQWILMSYQTFNWYLFWHLAGLKSMNPNHNQLKNYLPQVLRQTHVPSLNYGS